MDVAYTYDALYQLKTLTGKYRATPSFGYQWSDTFVYDNIGNIKNKAQSQDRLAWDNTNVTPTFDPTEAIGQLDGSRFDHNVVATTYTLDYAYANGRPHATSTVNETSPGQAAASRNFNYDSGGNNTGNTFRGTTRVQTWDEENRLKQVTVGGASVAKFRYDDAGERTKKQTAAGDSWYVNQYFVLLPGNLPTKHIFAGETRVASKTDAITMTKPATTFYHGDNLGTTTYTSNVDQDLVQHERYFAFGELWRPNAEQEEIDLSRPDNLRRQWTFTGKEFDVEEGLYYFGALYFDPRTAVWQSPDPSLAGYLKGGAERARPKNLSLYTYGWNNPVVLLDPNGREVWPEHAAAQREAAAEQRRIKANEFQAAAETAIRAGARAGHYRGQPQLLEAYGILAASGGDTSFQSVKRTAQAIGLARKTGADSYLVNHIGNRADVSVPADIVYKAVTLALAGELAGAALGAAFAPGRILLGRYPDYVVRASQLNARVFNLPSDVYNAMSPEAQWAANTRFIDKALSRGDEIILSNPLSAATPGTSFLRELEYLTTKGVDVSKLQVVP
jgi:RHS repeat-associated protein